MQPYIISASSIIAVVDGIPYQVNAANKGLYDTVKRLIKAGNFADIPDAIDRAAHLAKRIAAKAHGFGDLTVRDRKVYLREKDGSERRLQGYEITKLLELLDAGFDITPMANFIVRVRSNPNEPVQARLYEFMEYGNLPLTSDGCFLAYKVVRNNYLDKHSGSFDNSVGKTCEMKREAVDDNDNQTCSRGLHACSKEYIEAFLYEGAKDRLMVVKIAPEDVVSIPVDYNNTKLRTCKYVVVGEIKKADDPKFFGQSIYKGRTIDFDDDCPATSYYADEPAT